MTFPEYDDAATIGDCPRVEALGAFEAAEPQLPAAVRERFGPIGQELTHWGFHSPIYHVIVDPRDSSQTYMATFRHQGEACFARICHRVWANHRPPGELYAEFVSGFFDGGFLWTTASPRSGTGPANFFIHRLPGAGPTALWSTHYHELQRLKAGRRIIPIQSDDELRGLLERHHKAVRNFCLNQGAAVPTMQSGAAQAFTNSAGSGAASAYSSYQSPFTGPASPAAVNQPPSAVGQTPRYMDLTRLGDDSNALILEEMRKLETKRAGWGSSILLFLASLAMFWGAGKADWSREILWFLVPILFFHELGHYIAMKVFGYRNLRMFFIPMLGAAVTGRHYNVAGWKKAIVSLMGPVPGILVGTALGIAGIVTQHAILVKVAMLAVIINGFNLLPFLPLDGGWVMHSVLFSRNYILGAVFRVVAAAGLLLISIVGGGKFLMYLAIAPIITLPSTFKKARIAQELRAAGLRPISPDDQTIPPDIAQIIIGKVKEAYHGKANTKQIAEHTMDVFETMNARPPGALASIGLTAVHALSFLLALVLASVLAVEQNGGVRAMLRQGANAPPHRVDPSTELPVSIGPSVFPYGPAGRSIVVANFSRFRPAHDLFDDLRARLPADASVRQFGQSVFLSLPANDLPAQSRWLAELQKKDAAAFVDAPASHTTLVITCVARDAESAKAIAEEISEYQQFAPSFRLIPPWQVGDTRSPAERARHRMERHTYKMALIAGSRAYRDVAAEKLSPGLGSTTDEDSPEALKSIEKYQAAVAAARLREIQKLRDSHDPTLDMALIDDYLDIVSTKELKHWSAAIRDRIAPRLGQLPPPGTHPAPPPDSYATASNLVRQDGMALRFEWLTFHNLADGAPAFVDWLHDQGCRYFRYDIQAPPAGEEDKEPD